MRKPFLLALPILVVLVLLVLNHNAPSVPQDSGSNGFVPSFGDRNWQAE